MPLRKRAFDLAVSVLLLIVLSPLLAAVALMIRLRDGPPVLYVSERMQTPERPFALLKFRTMSVAGAERGVSGGDKASRITATGRWLRRYRLDELPQLWNVVRGDISLVGPRPPLREYVERFPDVYREVLRCRPGITGLATLYAHRHEEWLLAGTTTPEETDRVYVRRCIPLKARLDGIYRRNWSLGLDLRLLVATAVRTIR